MDGYEATRILFSRIQNMDPENASKIMGLLLFQDPGEKEMIRLAFGPEALVHSVILKTRKELGQPSNYPSTPSTPSPSPFISSNSVSVSRQNSSTSRLSGISIAPLTIPNPSSATSATWSSLSELQIDSLMSPNNLHAGSSIPSINSSALPFYGNEGTDAIDEFQLQDQLSFLNDGSPTFGPKNPDLFNTQSDSSSSPTGGNDHMLNPPYWGGSVHKRSCSVNDMYLGSDDPNSGLGWKPCLYYARGYCKNGTSCRFLHGGHGDVDTAAMVGSPSTIEMMEQYQELLRSKSAQQQKLTSASQLMAASSFPYSPKCMNLRVQPQQHNDAQRAAAALINEDLHKFGRFWLERNDFSLNGGSGIVSPASRQIYLTFPADSTFREEDVSNYFSVFGPVQDVRIPYQQKRMFGFVTFVYPETVKLILSKGNPHFVCDARVLVKPYKEKGKVPDKYSCRKQQQVERGEYSQCGTPTGLDVRDPFDFQLGSDLGARMLYNTQDMLWRKKMVEQADLQQALELQSRKLMSLQLFDMKKNHHHSALSTGSPIPSPVHYPNQFNRSVGVSSLHGDPEVREEDGLRSVSAISTATPGNHQPLLKTNKTYTGNEVPKKVENGISNGKNSPTHEDNGLPDCLEHNLPDSPFASPTKATADYLTAFTNEIVGDANESDKPFITNKFSPATSTLDMGAFKSFHCQIPRFSSGHGTIGMFAGTGGPIGI